MTIINTNNQNFTPTLLYSLLEQRRNQKRKSPYGENDFEKIAKIIRKNKELSTLPTKQYLGRGASAVVFELEDGKVIKFTQSNHFPLNRPVEEFDVPIIKKGRIGKIRYYIEEKLLQHDLNEGFIDYIAGKIKQKGYRVCDMDCYDFHQIGFAQNGNLYLLDPECAKYKNIFQALFRKIKRLFIK